jgi:hypothetical protein
MHVHGDCHEFSKLRIPGCLQAPTQILYSTFKKFKELQQVGDCGFASHPAQVIARAEEKMVAKLHKSAKYAAELLRVVISVQLLYYIITICQYGLVVSYIVVVYEGIAKTYTIGNYCGIFLRNIY